MVFLHSYELSAHWQPTFGPLQLELSPKVRKGWKIPFPDAAGRPAGRPAPPAGTAISKKSFPIPILIYITRMGIKQLTKRE